MSTDGEATITAEGGSAQGPPRVAIIGLYPPRHPAIHASRIAVAKEHPRMNPCNVFGKVVLVLFAAPQG